MSLRDTLQADLKQAMRDRDARRKSALRMVLLSIQMAEVESGELSDQEVLSLIQKEVKRRKEALVMVQDAGRTDLETVDLAEIAVLEAYLPEQLDAAEIANLARVVIAEVGATSPKDAGKVMQALMPQVQGRAEGRLVNQVVRDLLLA
ncbi:MAG: GatB/YqeY domain-containing protein [Anaerolineae bacterium]|nr:GatB/YqeY domain-containing protein [Anaerolineae bacterium]